jgi:hypothetical protein
MDRESALERLKRSVELHDDTTVAPFACGSVGMERLPMRWRVNAVKMILQLAINDLESMQATRP